MASAASGTASEETSRAASGAVAAGEAAEIAVDGYIYGYPLVLAEASRRVMSNVDPTAVAAGFLTGVLGYGLFHVTAIVIDAPFQ